ncbi:hypothetical protein CMUS01_04024 [Colletotrichum musicola]|uniref:Uncharacterized protein n=1 Tax=Colletotrichum musicola TaxID=2175873 RepID=A0A8H6NPH6_9PEZI|nr:hypothetical protein CMUS01_04024 [Colletotrichum musicola]
MVQRVRGSRKRIALAKAWELGLKKKLPLLQQEFDHVADNPKILELANVDQLDSAVRRTEALTDDCMDKDDWPQPGEFDGWNGCFAMR